MGEGFDFGGWDLIPLLFLIARRRGEEESFRVSFDRGKKSLRAWVVWKGEWCRSRHSLEKNDICLSRH